MSRNVCSTGSSDNLTVILNNVHVCFSPLPTIKTPFSAEVVMPTPTGNRDDLISKSLRPYGLRQAEQRRKPSRFVEISPPLKNKKPRNKREPTRRQISGKQPRKNTAPKQSSMADKEETSSLRYFTSPPSNAQYYPEEGEEGYPISDYADLEPLPGLSSLNGHKHTQLKKTKRAWLKTNRSLFDISPSVSVGPVFRVPNHNNTGISQLKGKRKAEDAEPVCATEINFLSAPASKRQHIESSATTDCDSAAESYFNSMSTGSNQNLDYASKKRKSDEIEPVFDGNKLNGSLTETPMVKRQRVNFRLENSDLNLSYVLNSSVNESSLNQTFESVSDIFNLSSGCEMNKTRDSIGINISFDTSFSRSFNNSFSHLAELI